MECIIQPCNEPTSTSWPFLVKYRADYCFRVLLRFRTVGPSDDRSSGRTVGRSDIFARRDFLLGDFKEKMQRMTECSRSSSALFLLLPWSIELSVNFKVTFPQEKFSPVKSFLVIFTRNRIESTDSLRFFALAKLNARETPSPLPVVSVDYHLETTGRNCSVVSATGASRISSQEIEGCVLKLTNWCFFHNIASNIRLRYCGHWSNFRVDNLVVSINARYLFPSRSCPTESIFKATLWSTVRLFARLTCIALD